jgi:hypothetical protein
MLATNNEKIRNLIQKIIGLIKGSNKANIGKRGATHE